MQTEHPRDDQKPAAWYVYVAEHQNAYAVLDEDDPQWMDDATNHGATREPLYDAQTLRDVADRVLELEAAEEGAKEAFGVVVQEKRDLEAECRRLRGLLDDCHAQIRRQAALLANSKTPNAGGKP